MKTHVHVTWYLFDSFWEWEIFWKKVVGKTKTRFMFNNFSPVYEIMWKMRQAQTGQRWGCNTTWERYNLRFAYRMTKTRIHTHTHTFIIFNTYGDSTAKVLTQTRHYVTLNVNCVSCCIYKRLTQHFSLSFAHHVHAIFKLLFFYTSQSLPGLRLVYTAQHRRRQAHLIWLSSCNIYAAQQDTQSFFF